MSDESKPLFRFSGQVYTNLGDLRDQRVTVVLPFNDFLDALTVIQEQHGYANIDLGDEMVVKIRVDLIQEVT